MVEVEKFSVPILLIGIAMGIVIAALMLWKYRQSPSKPLLYMITPLISIVLGGILLSSPLFAVFWSDQIPLPDPEPLPPALAILAAALLAGFNIGFANFIQKVFRPKVKWAIGLATAIGTVFLLSYVDANAPIWYAKG